MNDELRQEIEDDGFDPEAVRAWANYVGEPVTEWDRPTREAFEDAYEGEFDSFEHYVQETCCEWSGLSSGGVYLNSDQVTGFCSYIDWGQVAHDWECSGEWFTAPATTNPYAPDVVTSVYVFRAV